MPKGEFFLREHIRCKKKGLIFGSRHMEFSCDGSYTISRLIYPVELNPFFYLKHAHDLQETNIKVLVGRKNAKSGF